MQIWPMKSLPNYNQNGWLFMELDHTNKVSHFLDHLPTHQEYQYHKNLELIMKQVDEQQVEPNQLETQ